MSWIIRSSYKYTPQAMLGDGVKHYYMSEEIIDHWWGRWSVCFCSEYIVRLQHCAFFSVMASCINSAPRYLVHIIGGRVGGGDKYRAETIRFGLNVVHKSRPYHLLMQEENGWDQPRILTRSENGEQTRNRFQRRTRICPPQWTDSWPLIILAEKLVTFFFFTWRNLVGLCSIHTGSIFLIDQQPSEKNGGRNLSKKIQTTRILARYFFWKIINSYSTRNIEHTVSLIFRHFAIFPRMALFNVSASVSFTKKKFSAAETYETLFPLCVYFGYLYFDHFSSMVPYHMFIEVSAIYKRTFAGDTFYSWFSCQHFGISYCYTCHGSCTFFQ